MLELLSKIKAYQARGSGWIQIVMSFGIITANIELFKEYLPAGVSVPEAIFISGVIYLFGTVFLGWFDARYGIWGREAGVSSMVNVRWREMYEKVNEIHQEMKK